MRATIRQVCRHVLRCLQRDRSEEDLRQPAIVFAPHPDDEALGCGGTIIRKRQAGAEVKIVFMTDGSHSHSELMAPRELSALRVTEALGAARVLGVAEQEVIFLGFEDGQLSLHEEAAVRQVAELLQRQRPDEVFIPYYNDGPRDHWATTKIVRGALRSCRPGLMINEYPVWFWHHWPWTRLEGRLRERLNSLRESLEFSWGLFRDFRCAVRIGPVLEQKRAALAQHQSQVQRLLPDPAWRTLGDVADGEFLACFFQEREIFYRHRVLRDPPPPTIPW